MLLATASALFRALLRRVNGAAVERRWDATGARSIKITVLVTTWQNES
jgi:hypothetical protein